MDGLCVHALPLYSRYLQSKTREIHARVRYRAQQVVILDDKMRKQSLWRVRRVDLSNGGCLGMLDSLMFGDDIHGR